ncbi:DUF2637 domain-containing protein [Streptomyces olivoreticuli]|uniref:DUF2637 domain-containing protein n=1 Tax=Streptomyces olivoreticuli TaxID=68246 RepID=UPI00265A6AA4|nr:DUF2637 domain-containing protein [Streptomyces olivoreticuli]WKK27174.1 DUF2637 domain-containing protein [Streptomyces olivoreticuli]
MVENRITQRTVTVVMAVIAGLAFVFSFGNVWALALRLGVPAPVAPLIAPMVDLSVVGLLVGLRYLSLRGVPAAELKAATRLMHLSGLLTLALNIAEPIAAGHYGRAAVDAVAPLLLLGWGQVGPQLLRHFHTVTTPEPGPAVEAAPAAEAAVTEPVLDTPAPVAEPEPSPAPVQAPAPVPPPRPTPLTPAAGPALAVPEPLLMAARTIAESHRAEHGAPITVPQLKARLGVGLPLATAAHAQLTA